MTTASHKCVYVNCFKDRRKYKHLSFFKFPVKNCERTKEWQKNSGNISIALMDVDSLRLKLICEKHFLPSDFIPNNKRKLLTKKAVPIQFVKEEYPETDPKAPVYGKQLNMNLKTYGRKRQIASDLSSEFETQFVKVENSDVADDCCDQDQQRILSSPNTPTLSELNAEVLLERNNSPSMWSTISDNSTVSDRIMIMPSRTNVMQREQCKRLTHRITYLKKKLKAYQAQNYRLKKKLKSLSRGEVLKDLLEGLSPAAKTFVRMQICHKGRTTWTQSEKDLALTLYSKFPGAYKFFIENLKFTLPSIRTVQSWS